MENDWELDLMRLNVKVISTVHHNNSMTSFISFDCWKFLRMRPSEIKFEGHVSSIIIYWLLKNFENHGL